MKYRKLGASDLEVSEISLGSWLTYGVGVEADAARACLDRAFEVGINFIDTANIYGHGAAETFLGEALAGPAARILHPRHQIVLPDDRQRPRPFRGPGRKAARRLAEAARTDHVDLYQCHRYDEETPLEETMRALTRAVESGKTRYIGFSEWPADKIRAAIDMSGVVRFVSSQPQYSLLWRAPEKEVIPLSAANGISQIVWSPLAQGVLTGKYQARRAAAGGQPRDQRGDGRLDRRLAAARRCSKRSQRLKPLAAEAGPQPRPIRARLGAARAQCRLGDRRRLAPGPGRRECRRLGRRGRSGPVRRGRADRRRSALTRTSPSAGDLQGRAVPC